jgi:hypothetical protein
VREVEGCWDECESEEVWSDKRNKAMQRNQN